MTTQTRDTLDRLYFNILDTYKAYSFWLESEYFDHAERNELLIKYDLKRMLAIKLDSMMQNVG